MREKQIPYILYDLSKSKEDTEKNMEKLYNSLKQDENYIDGIKDVLSVLPNCLHFHIRLDDGFILYGLAQDTKKGDVITGAKTIYQVEEDNLRGFYGNLMIFKAGYNLKRQ